jgi:hypothetical protein
MNDVIGELSTRISTLYLIRHSGSLVWLFVLIFRIIRYDSDRSRCLLIDSVRTLAIIGDIIAKDRNYTHQVESYPYIYTHLYIEIGE